MFVFFKQKTAYEMRISDWSSDVCSSDLESHAEIEALLRDERLEVREVLFLGRIGVMIGESAIDLREEQMVFAGQPCGQQFQRGAGGAVAGIPADAQR